MPRSYAFGWGRRVCQGKHIAEASIFIVLARILWAFELHAPKLPDPADETAAHTWGSGFVCLPELFGVAFSAREGRREIIKAAYEAAQIAWAEMGMEEDVR